MNVLKVVVVSARAASVSATPTAASGGHMHRWFHGNAAATAVVHSACWPAAHMGPEAVRRLL